MTYAPTTWADEIPGETPAKYVITDDVEGVIASSATIDLATAPTAGTPVNATNLNNIEAGIVANEAALAALSSKLATYVSLVLEDAQGVLSALTVSQSSPPAQSVTVAPGKVTILGIGRVVQTGDSRVLTINSNTSGNPRIDVVIARATASTEAITLAVLEGTPAASPTPPALTQTIGYIWEEALAHVAVADGFSTIVDGDITDYRRVIDLRYSTGDIKPLLHSTVPDGWLLLNGQAVNRIRYADLFSLLGTTYGVGDGSTTFNLPDLRGRVLAGLDNIGGSSADRVTDASADSLGGSMGEETHQLTESEMPEHSHAQTRPTSTTGGNTMLVSTSSGEAPPVATAYDTDTAGGDQAHNNMQPTMFVSWAIKW